MADDVQYRTLLQNLLPTGAAWPRDEGATLTKVLHGLGGELARMHGRADDLIEESDPRTTFELLPDWERAAGLPDPCTAPAITLQERRARLVQKLTGLGGQSIAYFLSVAEHLGYVGVTIEEFRPFVCGESRCGDPLNGGHAVRHNWKVHVPGPRVTYFRTGESRCGDKLVKIDRADDLECIFGRLKPAQSNLIFAYEGV